MRTNVYTCRWEKAYTMRAYLSWRTGSTFFSLSLVFSPGLFAMNEHIHTLARLVSCLCLSFFLYNSRWWWCQPQRVPLVRCHNRSVSEQSSGKFAEHADESFLDHSNYAASRPSMTTTYDHRHHHPWHSKPSYAIFHPPATHFPTHSTGASQSSLDMTTTNKPYYPSFVDSLPNLNNTNPNFYRRHSTCRHLSIRWPI